MKKKLYRLFFAFIFILFLIQSTFYLPRHNFNSLELKDNIKFLASDNIQGRLPGTKENDIIANELSKKLKELGLVPVDKNFKEGFQLTVPYKINEDASLSLTSSSGTTIKDFIYGKDFKEDMLNFKDSSISLNKNDNMKTFEKALTFYKDNNLFLFYISEDEDFEFRSSFMHDSPFAFAVSLNADSFNLIKSKLYSGASLNVQLPYSTKTTEVFNIVGQIKGSNPDLKPLVLSAHFDHLGTDCLNNIYCGALDNASGSCFLLETAKVFSSIDLKPKRDIIFAFLNAEEFGLLGSEAFAKSHSTIVKDAEVINLDMLGSSTVPLSLIRGEKEKDVKSSLENSIKELSPNLEVKFEDSSDHSSFSKYGADSLTLTHGDISKIHTPNDKPEYISTTALDSAFKIVEKKIITDCYSPIKQLLLNDYIYLGLFSILLIFIMYKNIKYIKNR